MRDILLFVEDIVCAAAQLSCFFLSFWSLVRAGARLMVLLDTLRALRIRLWHIKVLPCLFFQNFAHGLAS